MRPRAKDVKLLDDYTLLVTFTNDEKRIFDVKPYLGFKTSLSFVLQYIPFAC